MIRIRARANKDKGWFKASPRSSGVSTMDCTTEHGRLGRLLDIELGNRTRSCIGDSIENIELENL